MAELRSAPPTLDGDGKQQRHRESRSIAKEIHASRGSIPYYNPIAGAVRKARSIYPVG